MIWRKVKQLISRIDTTKRWFIFNYYLCATIILIASERQPAYAQFLLQSEKAIKKLATGKDAEDDSLPMNNLIKVLMNVVRILYGIYMIYGVLSTWQSIQRDENWSKAATPPIFLLIAVTICDNVLSNIFLSSTGSGSGQGSGQQAK